MSFEKTFHLVYLNSFDKTFQLVYSNSFLKDVSRFQCAIWIRLFFGSLSCKSIQYKFYIILYNLLILMAAIYDSEVE